MQSRANEGSREAAPYRERSHRPNRSNEVPQFRKGPNGLLIPVRPKVSENHSNAESSRRDGRSRRSSDPDNRSSMTPEEREAREKRRRERASRHGRASSRDSKMTDITIVAHATDGRKRRNKHVDVVDKLDVTGGLYGVGSSMFALLLICHNTNAFVSAAWHHDGPFDACRPQRNRKRDNMAPMGAFPTNSANQTMGGSGPVNKHFNLEQFHGRGTEGYNDYAASSYDLPKPATAVPVLLSATNKVEPLHGEESLGLGTSTFLEGAPASRADMQRTKTESSGVFDGLSRKKSIAARFRGMSQSKARPYDAGAPAAPIVPEESVERGSPISSPARRKPTRLLSENNARGNRYDDAYAKKGAAVEEAEVGMGASSSPTREPLSRRSTTDNVMASDSRSPTSGFLGRVRSLKGGSGRSRTDRNAS